MQRNLGMLLEGQGKTAEALESYNKVLEIEPNDVKAHQLIDNILKK